jgi:succinate-acetate transporter protein
MLMFITTGWGEDATIAAVISYAIFYGGFGQMVAGVFEVRALQFLVSAAAVWRCTFDRQRACWHVAKRLLPLLWVDNNLSAASPG